MLFLSRLFLLVLVSLTLASCGTANSAGRLLMAPLSLGMRTLGTVGRSVGG